MSAAWSAEMLSRVPIIVVVGATGTGKTKLSVELAKKFGGEIINADSMQVYSGLDILTNKATAAEQQGVPHHLLGHIKPGDNYNIHRFRSEAFKIIENISARNKVPIIVGGTHYYVESILWKILIEKNEAGSPEDSGGAGVPEAGYVIAGRRLQNLEGDLDELPLDELRDMLKEIDPVSWKMRHDGDRRKIQRSIQVFGQTGRRHSDILEEQRKEGSVYGGSLRYPNAVVFWMQCNKEILQTRLKKRVDEMMEQGLLGEVEAFHKEVNLKRGEIGCQDFAHSLFQSIGFKELVPYLELPAEERDTAEGVKLLEHCVWLLKQRTMRYANKQEAWIRNRLLVHGREAPPVWPLDGSDPTRWLEQVSVPAAAVLEARLRAELPPADLIAAVPKERRALDPEQRHALHDCQPCDRTFIGLEQLEVHLHSKKHRHVLAKIKNKQAEVVAVLDQLAARTAD